MKRNYIIIGGIIRSMEKKFNAKLTYLKEIA